jgi:type IV pilus assembly protein PilW
MRRAHHMSRSSSRGVTLVELMVSIAIGMLVLVGLSAVYVAAKSSFRFQETSGRLQEDATFALDAISRDLRMAGFAGCRGVSAEAGPTYYPIMSLSSSSAAIDGPNPMATVVSTGDPNYALVALKPLSPQNFIRGFDSVQASMFASGQAPASGTTDSLFFSTASSRAVSVTAAMTSGTSNLTIGADAFGWAGATANSGVYTMVVSDCVSSNVFAGKIAGGGAQIDHSAAMGNATGAFVGGAQYGVDALVMPLEWSYYYVATRSGAATPSLYRVFYDGNERKTPEELVANVETIKFHYGENTANDLTTGAPTLQADVWRTTAASVTDWSRVVAVRVGIMMLSDDQNANPDVTASPVLLGQSYTIPTGASTTRLRKEFSTTVVLRNRVAAR